MREPNLMMSLLMMLIFPLEAHRQWCGPDNAGFECKACEPGQNGTVKYKSYLYECVNGQHQGPQDCLTKFNETIQNEYWVVRKNRRGIYKLRPVENCLDPSNFLEISCTITRDQLPTFKCVNRQEKDCISPNGAKVPLGVGIEEKGNMFFCAVRHYSIFYDFNRDFERFDVPFLYDCRFDHEDYMKSLSYRKFDNKWDFYCKKEKTKFILPNDISYELLDQTECTHVLKTTVDDQIERALFAIPNGKWLILDRKYNVSCSRAGEAKVENCVSWMQAPIPFGVKIFEYDPYGKKKMIFGCQQHPLNRTVEEAQ